MTVDDLDKLGIRSQAISPGKYRLDAVPKPHSAFEGYVVQIAPRAGLSWIKGIGTTIESSVFGLELKGAFDALESKLASTYGRFNRTDMLLPDSIWNEPREWMQSLLNRERYLLTGWSREHGSSLPDSLQSVGLVCTAIDTESGFLGLEYSFENEPLAEAEISAAEDDAL